MSFVLAASCYLFSIFLNTVTAIFIKYLHINTDLTLNQIIALRSFFAILLLTPFIIKPIKAFNKKDMWSVILVGFLATADIYMWHNGVSTVPINNASVMSFLLPILITIFASLILKEPIYIGSIIAIFISFFSINLIYKTTPDAFGIGYIILLGDFIIGALGFVLTKKLTHTYNPLLIVYFKIAIILPISILLIGSFPLFNLYSFIFIFFCSVVYVLERYFLTLAYKLHDMLPLQPLRFFNLIFSFFLSFLILNERISRWQVYAALLVILANLINIFMKTKPIYLYKK